MLTSREMASAIIIAGLVLVVIIVPKFRRHMAPSMKAVLKAAFAPRLVWVYVIVVAASAVSTWIAWCVGLWDVTLLKDAVLLTAAVALPMTFRAMSFASGGELAHKLVRDTLTLAAVITVYLDAAPLPLLWETLYQIAAAFLVMVAAFAATKPEWVPAKRFCEAVLLLMGAFLLIWTTVSLMQTPPDWSEFFQSLFFSFWLPISLLPFFYVFGFYAVTDKVRARFRAIKKPFTARLMLAFMIGTRLRLSLLARFGPRYNSVADASGFRDGLQRMREFRSDLARRDLEEAARLGSLSRNSGAAGVDGDGLHIDRREFDVTKKRLDWIWTCQNGQYDRQGGRYWDHLTDWIVDADRHGLPTDHGFVVQVADDAQVWRAWRRTPGGAVLGVGGRERSSRYYFQGDDAPTAWPGAGDAWVDAARASWPPDWNRNDGTRL